MTRRRRTWQSRFRYISREEMHTLFLLYSIEGLTDGWSDAPFALGLVDPEHRDIPARKPRQGWLLNALLADADTGIVRAIRGVSFTPAFSAAFDALVAEQRTALSGFTGVAHDAERAAAYARWRSAEDMLGAAAAVEEGGLPFHAG